MINLILLTGFLGAGKTTLLKSILGTFSDKRIGVIVNEFGTINIDAVHLKRDGIKMAELDNGSIFCACIKEDFLSALVSMSSTGIDFLFVEASGLADPSSIQQILRTIENKTISNLDYRGAICVIDADSYLGLAEVFPALINQVAYSSAIILNKADLVDKKRLDIIKSVITQINPDALQHVASFCNVDIKRIIEDLQCNDRDSVASTNTFESRPHTYTLTAEEVLPLAQLKQFLEIISVSAYRIKGFSNTDKGSMEINIVGQNVKIIPWEGAAEGTQIVIISSVGIKMLSVIVSELDCGLKNKLHF